MGGSINVYLMAYKLNINKNKKKKRKTCETVRACNINIWTIPCFQLGGYAMRYTLHTGSESITLVLNFVPTMTELKEEGEGLSTLAAHVIFLRSIDTFVLVTNPPGCSICSIICKLLLVSPNKTHSNELHDLLDWFKNFPDHPPFDICPNERIWGVLTFSKFQLRQDCEIFGSYIWLKSL